MAAGPVLVERAAVLVARLFYRLDVTGGVPPRGPVLLLPNHPNALLDPALVIATAGRPVRFLAKSTLFSGAFGPLLRAAGAIPVFRRQDGADMDRNSETFAAVDAALGRGEAICIFPEGKSHSTGRLEALRTGAARMALSAAARGIPVQLVPVGINHDAKVTFRSPATVSFGTPFSPAATDPRELTGVIAAHMRTLIVEADPAGDAALVERLERLYRVERGLDTSPAAVVERRRVIAAGLDRIRDERPDWYDQALVQLRRYDDRLRRFRLRDAALGWDLSAGAAARFAARELPVALLLVPAALTALLVFAVPYALTAAAARLSRETDVTATVKVFGGAAIYGAWFVTLALMAAWLGGAASGVTAAVVAPCLAVAGLFAIERESAAWRTARAWLAARSARHTTRSALKRRRAELAAILDEVHGWLRGYDS